MTIESILLSDVDESHDRRGLKAHFGLHDSSDVAAEGTTMSMRKAP